MVQILDQGLSPGEAIGGGIGQGISSGLQLLMQEKLSKMQQRKKAAALEEVGIPGGLAALDPAILKEFAKSKAQEQAIQSLFGAPAPLPTSKAALQPSLDLQEGGVMDESKAALQPSVTEEAAPEIDRVPPGAARLKEMNDAELQILQGFPAFKDIAKSELDMREKTRDVGEKREAARAKREFERAKPVLARADERAESIALKETSLNLMENAIEEGNIGFLSPDNLAEITGIEALRTGKGAQFVSAGKEFFLGSLKRAGARPNQWIEQQIQKMLPKIGRTRLANLTVVEALKSEMAIDRKGQELLSEFSDADEEKYGYIRGNIGQRVSKELKTFANEEQKTLKEKLEGLESAHSNRKSNATGVLMLDPAGKLRRVPKENIKEAQEAGYKLK